MKLLSKKNVLITGASRGIGKGIVSSFINQGANVAFTYNSSSLLANEIVNKPQYVLYHDNEQGKPMVLTLQGTTYNAPVAFERVLKKRLEML